MTSLACEPLFNNSPPSKWDAEKSLPNIYFDSCMQKTNKKEKSSQRALCRLAKGGKMFPRPVEKIRDGISWKPRKQKKKDYKVFREAKEFYNRRKEKKRREGERKRESKMAQANESWQHFLQLLVESEVDFASKPTQREASPHNIIKKADRYEDTSEDETRKKNLNSLPRDLDDQRQNGEQEINGFRRIIHPRSATDEVA